MNRHLTVMPSPIRRLYIAAAATVVLAGSVVMTSPTASAADHSVDPTTLTPPPPDFFNASCRQAGQQILCDLAFVEPDQPVEAPTGLFCGSGPDTFELLETFIRTVRGIRTYGTDGLLLRRHFNDDYDGTFTNSATGATVSYSQHDEFLHNLTVPGDTSSGAERQTTHQRIFSSNGTVLIDAGRMIVSTADGEVLFKAGQHPMDDYANGDPTALQSLCDALSA